MRSSDLILNKSINKNSIISKYNEDCHKLGYSGQLTSTKKGEPTHLPTTYPSIFQLVRDCSMKPDASHYYRVQDLRFENVIVIVLKPVEGYLSGTCIKKLHCLSRLFNEMATDVCRLRNMNFSELKEPRIGYADQLKIQASRVDLATAGIIHYSLHPGMLIRYVKGEYVGESRDVSQIIKHVSPYIDKADVAHIERILTKGCPSIINFEEASDMKSFIIDKGNQATFKMYPEIVTKTMNKEDRYSHLLPVKLWVLYFSPWCRHTAQGILIKPGKNPRVIFDASTKGSPHEVVLNEITPTELEANIDFGLAKMKLLIRIYNLRISYPQSKIFLALADITACFRFPRMHADVTGAFGFMAEELYFLATSMVFGSNTSASSWEPFRRAIQSLIPVLSMRTDLVEKHKGLLDMLVWGDDDNSSVRELVQAFKCPLNPGAPDQDGPLEAYIYVDDILASGVGKQNILRLLAAIVEAVFIVCGRSMIEVRQCPISIEKWLELVIGTIQTILGLTVDTNLMTVGITPQYRQQVFNLITEKWPDTRRIFKVKDIQMLVGKVARLGEGAPWIYKIMSHVYTSLAYALKQNELLLKECSPKFRDIVSRIERKQFSGNQREFAKELNFALKTASKMVNSHSQVYLINETMREELKFIRQALHEKSTIPFEVPIAFIIPRTPTASLFGDSSLISCGGYSIDLRFWWFIPFPDEIVARTLLHLKNNDDQSFISINVLEYVTVIINYCGALTTYMEDGFTDDPHPVVLCVTDNVSAKNWTMHTCKKSIVGRALARFFCGLLIGSEVGINAKWISTEANKIADDISRLKKSLTSTTSSFVYDFSKLKQDHADLKLCRFYHPSQELLLMIWKIALTRKSPDLDLVLALKLSGLGKLSG